MENPSNWIAVAALFAALVTQSILGGLLLRTMARQIADLHEWHSVKDADGVFAWYVRRSLEKAIVKLADNIEVQNEILRDLIRNRDREPAKRGQ